MPPEPFIPASFSVDKSANLLPRLKWKRQNKILLLAMLLVALLASILIFTLKSIIGEKDRLRKVQLYRLQHHLNALFISVVRVNLLWTRRIASPKRAVFRHQFQSYLIPKPTGNTSSNPTNGPRSSVKSVKFYTLSIVPQ